MHSSANRSDDRGASSGALITIAQPAASAGPILVTAATNGPFQGLIPPTTPTGSRVVYDTTSSGREFSMVRPWMPIAAAAYQRSRSAEIPAVRRVSDWGAPISIVSR